jgi:hypothetical protein
VIFAFPPLNYMDKRGKLRQLTEIYINIYVPDEIIIRIQRTGRGTLIGNAMSSWLCVFRVGAEK